MADVNFLSPFIFKWEGGYNEDPADAGGATNMGVTLGTWRQVGYDKDGDGDIDKYDLKLLTRQEVVKKVLKPHYWDRWKADEIHSQNVANMLVDWVWGSGKHGIVIPQRLLGVAPDGIVGAKTLFAVNMADPDQLFEALYEERVRFLKDIVAQSVARYEGKIGRNATESELMKHTNKRFLRGWMNRLNDLKSLKR